MIIDPIAVATEDIAPTAAPWRNPEPLTDAQRAGLQSVFEEFGRQGRQAHEAASEQARCEAAPFGPSVGRPAAPASAGQQGDGARR